MKKTFLYGLMALVCGGVTSCSEEDNFDNNQQISRPGDKIVFNADAAVKAGNEAAKTGRTIYGDINDTKDKIALNWVGHDSIDIAYKVENSNKTASATYEIPEAENNKPIASSLISKNELKWEGTEVHNFYAIYPSSKVFDKYELGEKSSFNLDINNAMAEGFVPKSYTVKDTLITVTGEPGNRVYIIKPNMDFAYMVAKNSIKLAEANQKGGISLSFTPLATALEFEIKANEIGVEGNDEIIIDRVDFIAHQSIVGGFTYDFNTQTLKHVSSSKESDKPGIIVLRDNHLSFDIDAVDYTKNIRMKKGDVCDITAFIIPDHDIDPSTMEVKIWYRQGIFPESKTAVLKNGIKIKHKYSYKNFELPQIVKPSKINDGLYYIKHRKTGKYFDHTADWKLNLVQKKKEELDKNQQWKLESKEAEGNYIFRLSYENKYIAVNRDTFDPQKNVCFLKLDGWLKDYFKLYTSRVYPNEVTYEMMYDHEEPDYNDGGHGFKGKCIKYFQDNEMFPLGLGLRGDAANVVILEAVLPN